MLHIFHTWPEKTHSALEANMIPLMISNKRRSLDWLNGPQGLKMSLFPRKTFVTSIHGCPIHK